MGKNDKTVSIQQFLLQFPPNSKSNSDSPPTGHRNFWTDQAMTRFLYFCISSKHCHVAIMVKHQIVQTLLIIMSYQLANTFPTTRIVRRVLHFAKWQCCWWLKPTDKNLFLVCQLWHHKNCKWKFVPMSERVRLIKQNWKAKYNYNLRIVNITPISSRSHASSLTNIAQDRLLKTEP